MGKQLFEQVENEKIEKVAEGTAPKEEPAKELPRKEEKDEKRQERADFFKAKQELSAKEKALAEREKRIAELEKEKSVYEKGLGEMGYTGEDAIFKAIAENTEKTVAEVKAAWEKKNTDIETAVKNHPAVKKAEELAAEYEKRAAEAIRQNDLIAIKAKYPDVEADDVSEFGDKFARLRLAGFDAVEAYKFVQQETTKKPVISTGSTKGGGGDTSDYFTLDEIKAMSKAEVEKNYDKIEKSLKKINK